MPTRRRRSVVRTNPRHRKRARKPDTRVPGGRYGVWYGPDGPRGDVATEVEHYYGDEWIVAEYQHLGGYVEDFDPDYPFLKISTVVKARGIRDAMLRGIKRIGHYGGDEEFVESLP